MRSISTNSTFNGNGGLAQKEIAPEVWPFFRKTMPSQSSSSSSESSSSFSSSSESSSSSSESSSSSSSSSANVIVVKGPYMIYDDTTDLITETTFLWQTDALESGVLIYGTTPELSGGIGSENATQFGDNQLSVVVDGLTAETKYYYQITSNGESHTGSFITAPTPSGASSAKLLAMGDTRTNSDDVNMVCGAALDYIVANPDYQTIMLHTGDWVEYNTEASWEDEWFPRDQDNILEMLSKMPVMGCIGNHEGTGTIYRKYYPYDYYANHYYAFDYGPAKFIVLDLYQGGGYTPGTAQYIWLENELQNNTKPWLFLLMHHSAYSDDGGHGGNSTVATHIAPLCVTYNVNAVIAGHNHYYSYNVVNDIPWITTGGGGAPLRAVTGTGTGLIYSESVFQFLAIDIQPNTTTFTCIDANDGSIVHQASVNATSSSSSSSSSSNSSSSHSSSSSSSSSYNVLSYSYAFTQVNSSGSMNCAASDATGENLFVTEYAGGIHVSGDYGATWNQNLIDSKNWYKIDISSDGSKGLAVSDDTNQIYVTTNSGVTWTAKGASDSYADVCISENGNIMYAMNDGGLLYKSINDGEDWTTPVDLLIMSTTMDTNLDGSRIVIVSDSDVYISDNSGASFTSKYSGSSLRYCSMSDDGMRIIVGSTNSNYIILSSNGGEDWITKHYSTAWWGVAVSNDGQHLIAFDNVAITLDICHDGGSTWNNIGTAPSISYKDSDINSDGSRIVFACDSNGIYTLTATPI